MKAKPLINQLVKLGFYVVDDVVNDLFFDNLDKYGTCTLQNDDLMNIDYIDITYDEYEILGYIEIGIDGQEKLIKPSKLIDYVKTLMESKKSNKKSLKESFDETNLSFLKGECKKLIGLIDDFQILKCKRNAKNIFWELDTVIGFCDNVMHELDKGLKDNEF